MGNSIRRAVMLHEGYSIGHEMTKRSHEADQALKNRKTEAVVKALVGYYENLLRPTKSTLIRLYGEPVWYTPPDSPDGLDTERGKLLTVQKGVARVKPDRGPERDIPVANLEKAWQEKLRKMGVWVPEASTK